MGIKELARTCKTCGCTYYVVYKGETIVETTVCSDSCGKNAVYSAPLDRYGNQFATRVEHNLEVGMIYADILQEANGGLCLMIGGIILSPRYITLEDARDAADVMLCRLADGEIMVEPMPEEEGYNLDVTPYPYDAQSVYEWEFVGEADPTGWDARDHKAMYE